MKNRSLIITLFLWAVITSSHSISAVIGHAEYNNVVYFADAVSDSSSLSRYDILNDSMLTSVPLDKVPTAITSDSMGVYVATGTELFRYPFVENGVSRQFLRNFSSAIQQVVVVGEFILVVSGEPDQMISVLHRSDGALKGEVPFELTEFGAISSIHYSASESYIIVKYGDAVKGSVFIVADFDLLSGDVTNVDKFEDEDIPLFSAPFFFENTQLVVGSSGEVVSFDATGVKNFDPIRDDKNSIIRLFGDDSFYSSGELKVALDHADFMLIGSSIENNCHEFNGGTRFRLVSQALGDLGAFDSTKDIHSIVQNGVELLLFYGEGNGLGVEKASELVVPRIFGSEEFFPLNVDFTPVQNLSATGLNGDVLYMHADASCDHHVVRWSVSTQSYLPSVFMGINTPVDTSYSSIQNQFYVLNNRTDDFYLRVVDFDEVPPARSGVGGFTAFDGQGSQVLATDNYVVLSYSDVDNKPRLAIISATTGLLLSDESNDGELWDVATWDSGTRRMYYVSFEGLFYRELNADGTLAAALPQKSPHYGVTQEASTNAEIVVSDDGALLMINGSLYVTDTLIQVDAIGEDEFGRKSDLFVWNGANLYSSISNEISPLGLWTLNIGADNHFGEDVSAVNLNGTNALLLPVMVGGSFAPLTVTVGSTGVLTYRTHGASPTSTSLGGSGNAGAGSNTGGGSDAGGGSDGAGNSQPAEPIGGSGGGSIDYMYLLLLALGFTIKRRKLN